MNSRNQNSDEIPEYIKESLRKHGISNFLYNLDEGKLVLKDNWGMESALVLPMEISKFDELKELYIGHNGPVFLISFN